MRQVAPLVKSAMVDNEGYRLCIVGEWRDALSWVRGGCTSWAFPASSLLSPACMVPAYVHGGNPRVLHINTNTLSHRPLHGCRHCRAADYNAA